MSSNNMLDRHVISVFSLFHSVGTLTMPSEEYDSEMYTDKVIQVEKSYLLRNSVLQALNSN